MMKKQLVGQMKTVVLAAIAFFQMTAIVLLIAYNSDLLQASEGRVKKDEEIVEQAISDEKTQIVNNDLRFWLLLSDRQLPVVQSKDNKDYLKLNLAREKDPMGTLFIDKGYSQNSPNMVIYGHSATNNNERLTLLKKSNYVSNNRIFYIEQNGEKQAYEIIAYFNSTLPEREIPYLQTDFRNRSDFEDFLIKAQKVSLIERRTRDFSGVRSSITLVTCDLSSKKEKRWVVVAIPLAEYS